MTGLADLTRDDFDRFFSAKKRELWRWAFRKERRRNVRDPELLAWLSDQYDAMAKEPQAPVPRRIFMLWQQGWDSAPPLVQACADSWRRHNPDWELHLLDDSSLVDLVPTWREIRLPERLGRPARSNVARMELLRAQGGVWADATLFATRSLDDWLPQAMRAGLFMFSRPRPYRAVDIWFMTALADNPALAAWHETVRRYWQVVRRPHHYYWMEYLLEFVASREAGAATVIEQMPKISAIGPLAVPALAFDRNAPEGLQDLIVRNRVPVHKLSHKWLPRGSLTGTPLAKLTGLQRL